MVFYEAPHRLAEVLTDMAELWGEHRPAVVCRELTKTYEEVRRGGLAELAEWAHGGVRGEVTLVVSGRDDVTSDVSDEDLQQAVLEAQAAGVSRKDAVTSVANSLGVPRRRVYQAAHQP
jgi:16S rRNA (cytidine1402-2'-O)-methyltransferase